MSNYLIKLSTLVIYYISDIFPFFYYKLLLQSSDKINTNGYYNLLLLLLNGNRTRDLKQSNISVYYLSLECTLPCLPSNTLLFNLLQYFSAASLFSTLALQGCSGSLVSISVQNSLVFHLLANARAFCSTSFSGVRKSSFWFKLKVPHKPWKC